MPFIEWTDELSIGIDRFDAEHKVFVEIINELHDGIESNHAEDVLAPVLDRLVDYARYHFANEEEFLAEQGYERLENQRSEHYAFTKKILDLQHRCREQPNEILSKMTAFLLKNWLLDHIEKKDKHYGETLAPALASKP